MSSLNQLNASMRSIDPAIFQNFELPKEEERVLPFKKPLLQEMLEDPVELCCSISLALFNDPVIDGVGHTYERSSIQSHFKKQREEQHALTSPLSQEVLDNDHLVPNRAKKSELEEYKTRKATRCFELAQQSLQKQCGDTALILVQRARYLNPNLQGLDQVEGLAQKTFVTAHRQMVVYTSQAHKMLQNNLANSALTLLKQMATSPTYVFSLSPPTHLQIFKSKFVALVDKYLITQHLPLAHTLGSRLEETYRSGKLEKQYVPNYTSISTEEYRLWDMESERLVDVFYFQRYEGPTKAVLIKTDLFLWRVEHQVKHPRFTYNLQSRNLQPLEINNNLREVYESRIKSSSYYREPRFVSTDDLVNVETKAGELVGFVYFVSANLIYKPGNESKETTVHLGTLVFLISGNGVKQINNQQGFEIKENNSRLEFTFTNKEEFIQTHFPDSEQEVKAVRQNGIWEGAKTAQFPLDSAKVMGIYRNRLLTAKNRAANKSSGHSDAEFSVYKIKYAYVLSSIEHLKFYETLVKAAIQESDIDSYLTAMEHLVGYYRSVRTWETLESLMVGIPKQREAIRNKLLMAIEESKAQTDNFWTSRLYLYLGLCESSIILKRQAYHEAQKWNPEDLDVELAIEHISLNHISHQSLQGLIEEQQKVIELMKQEMSKMQKQLVDFQHETQTQQQDLK